MLSSLCQGQLLPTNAVHFYDSGAALSSRLKEEDILGVFQQLEYLIDIQANLTSKCEFYGDTSSDTQKATARHKLISNTFPQIIDSLKDETNIFLKIIKASTVPMEDTKPKEKAKETVYALTISTTAPDDEDSNPDIGLQFDEGDVDLFESNVEHPETLTVLRFSDGKVSKSIVKLNQEGTLNVNANVFAFYNSYHSLKSQYDLLFEHVNEYLYNGGFKHGTGHSKVCSDFLLGMEQAIDLGIKYITDFNRMTSSLLNSNKLSANTFNRSKYETITTKLVQKGITKNFFVDDFDGLKIAKFDLYVYSHENHLFFRMIVPHVTHSMKLHKVNEHPIYTQYFGKNFLTQIRSPFDKFLAYKLGSFVPLTSDEIKDCLLVHNELYCQKNLIYHNANSLLLSGHCSIAIYLEDPIYIRRNCDVRIHPIEFAINQMDTNMYRIISRQPINIQGFSNTEKSYCGRETNEPRLYNIDRRIANLKLTSGSEESNSDNVNMCEIYDGYSSTDVPCFIAGCASSEKFTLSKTDQTSKSETQRKFLNFAKFLETKLSRNFDKSEIAKHLLAKNGYFNPYKKIHPTFEETSIKSYSYYLLLAITFTILSFAYILVKNSVCKIYEIILLRRDSNATPMWHNYVRDRETDQSAPPPPFSEEMVHINPNGANNYPNVKEYSF